MSCLNEKDYIHLDQDKELEVVKLKAVVNHLSKKHDLLVMDYNELLKLFLDFKEKYGREI